MGEGTVIAVGVLIVVAVVVARVRRANQEALQPSNGRRRDGRRDGRRSGARSGTRSGARTRRTTTPTEVQRPGLGDQPRGVTSGVYVLEVRHRRDERGDVDYLKIGRSSDVAEEVRAHQTIEGNNLQVYGIAWTTDHASLESQISQDLRPWRIDAPGVTAVELYEPEPEVYRRLDWLWR